MKKLVNITPMDKDFGKWYVDVLRVGKLIQYGLVRGTIAFKKNAFHVWENIQFFLNAEFKKANISNVYLPSLIPLKIFEQEKNHIKGFDPELATITRVGQKEIEPVVIRPTSEIAFANYFRNEIESHKDLPILINQWVNVVRWEKTTNPFLRNSEFLWQEGHTAHSDSESAEAYALKMINLYALFLKEFLAIATIKGEKTERERFAGAITTHTIESMMKDKKSLQVGTSHYLGQNFAIPMKIEFTDKQNQKKNVFQSSWGVSTRLIGALIMNHGDDHGIIWPPKIAPFQIDIIPVKENDLIKKAVEKIKKILSRFRLRILDNYQKSFSFRRIDSEAEGAPLRIEVGEREVENNKIIIVKRNDFSKISVKLESLNELTKELLKKVQSELYQQSANNLKQNIVSANSYQEMQEKVKTAFVICPFDGSIDDEKKIQLETSATVRCIPRDYNKDATPAKCIYTDKKTKRYVIFARAY